MGTKSRAKFLARSKGQTGVILIGVGISDLISGTFFYFVRGPVEQLIGKLAPEIASHRITLSANVIIHLYLLLGLSMITLGGFVLRHRIVRKRSNKCPETGHRQHSEGIGKESDHSEKYGEYQE